MAWWTHSGDHPRRAPIEVGNVTLPKISKSRRWLRVALHLAVLGYAVTVAYKTGRGDAFDTTEQVAQLSRRARAAEEALQVVEDAWTECILREPIRFPGDTMLRQTVTR